MENCNHYPETLGFFGLATVIGVPTFTSLTMTPVFHMNYPHLSETDIFLIYLGTARVIMNIFFNKNERSFFDRIKNTVKEY